MIIGVQKAGTTALAEFVAEHPMIEIASNKEAHVFDAADFSEDWFNGEITKRYEPLFTDAPGVLRGEATPIYIYLPGVVGRLRRYNPGLKLIVLLRDPVERAYSHYRMEFARGNESLPFWLALLLERWRLHRDRHSLADSSAIRRNSYRDRGYYNRQLRHVLSEFKPEQLLVLRTEELRKQHEKTMRQVFSFLGVQHHEVKAREVFSQPASIKEVPVASRLLRKFYQQDLCDLEDLLEFSVEDWRH